MTTEEILVRIGVSTQAMEAGLTRGRALVRGWSSGVMQDLKGRLGGWLAGTAVAGYVIESFRDLYKQILYVKNAMGQLGENSYFVQNLMRQVTNAGQNADEAVVSLMKFFQLVGGAQQGDSMALAKLQSWGLTVKDGNGLLKDKNQLLAEAAQKIKSLEGTEMREAAAADLFAKNWQTLQPILEKGAAGVTALTNNSSSFWDRFDIRPDTINRWKAGGNFLSNMLSAIKNGIANTVAHPARLENPLFSAFGLYADYAQSKKNPAPENQAAKDRIDEINAEISETPGGALFGGEKVNRLLKERQDIVENINRAIIDANAHNPQYLAEQMQLNDELYRQEETQRHIQDMDQHKFTVSQLADHARKILGFNYPQGLGAIHTLTPAMASALRIQSLEARAEGAAAYGKFGVAEKLQNEAYKLREANPALRLMEQEPKRELDYKLELLKKTLEITNFKVQQDGNPP